MIQNRLLIVVLLLLTALGVWGFFTFFESYQEEVSIGYSKDARTNPFFAAQLFLEQDDVVVLSDPNQLDFAEMDQSATIFLSSVDSVILTEKQVSEALDWIFAGGYLIVGVGQEIIGHASLLSSFDITAELIDNPNEDFVDFLEQELNQDEGQRMDQETESRGPNKDTQEELSEPEPLNYQLKLNDNEQELDIQVLDDISLAHPSQKYDEDGEVIDYQPATQYQLGAFAGDENGIRLMQFDYGEGVFTALSSDAIWRNDHIAAVDHAFFLSYMVAKDSSLFIYYNINAPSLFSLLRQYFWETMLSFCVLLLLWIWRSAQAVAGKESVKVGNRRLFSEHLTASAEFLFSRQQYTQLLEPLRDEINHLAAQWHPTFNTLSGVEQSSLMAQRTGLAESRITQWQRVMRDCHTQSNFETALRLGNHIREAYERHTE